MIEVWQVDFDAAETALEAIEHTHPRLADDDLERIAAVAAGNQGLARQRRLTSIALRLLIRARSGDPALDRRSFARNARGKPDLPGVPVSFSIAHAHGRALIALGDRGVRLGVDLEAMRDVHMTPERGQRLLQAGCSIVATAAARPLQHPARDLSLDCGHGFPKAVGLWRGSGQSPEIVERDSPAVSGGAASDVGATADLLRAWVRLEALGKALGCGVGHVLTVAGVLASRSTQPAPEPAQPTSVPPLALPHSTDRCGAADAPQDALARLAQGLLVHDLQVSDGGDGTAWFAALAGPADILGGPLPVVRSLPDSVTALQALAAGDGAGQAGQRTTP